LEAMSTTTVDLDEKTYGQLLRRTLPHVIRSDEECERLTSELLRLDEREDTSREEKELAELLTVLIEDYEERRHPIPKARPRQILRPIRRKVHKRGAESAGRLRWLRCEFFAPTSATARWFSWTQ